MKKAVIFDMDGVIIDSEPVYLQRTEQYLEHLGSLPEDRSELYSLVGCNRHVFQEKINSWTKGSFSTSDFNLALDEYFTDNPIDFTQILDPQAPEILQWFADNNIPAALASSSSPNTINAVVTSCNLERYFEHIISGFDFERSKPDPAIYLHSAKQLNIDPSDCLAVEDSPYGIEAANRAGIKVVAKIDSTFGMDQSKADGHIKSLLELKKYFK